MHFTVLVRDGVATAELRILGLIFHWPLVLVPEGEKSSALLWGISYRFIFRYNRWRFYRVD